MSQPFPPTALRPRHAQTIRDSTSSYKIDYIIVIKNFPHPISGLKGVDFAYWWSFIGRGLRLQPAQQACFMLNTIITFFLIQ